MRTPLHARHTALGAAFTDFAGWEMPLQYTSSLAEHQAVRRRAGLFDLSHMGEVRVQGPDAARALNQTFVSDLSRRRPGRATYTMLCSDTGGIVDDLIVYRLGEREFLVVPNAANVGRVVAALGEGAHGLDVSVEDQTQSTALIALQGPLAESILVRALAAGRAPENSSGVEAVRALRYYAEVPLDVGGTSAVVARTGYTGEDGFELFVPADAATGLWDLLTEAGRPDGLVPAGLGARDSLRLEAGMPLCGHELTESTTPFQVGAGRVVALDKPQDFPGRAALEHAATSRPDVVLAGLSAATRRAMRAGCAVLPATALAGVATDGADGPEPIGHVTSGLFSPTLGHAIALALVDVSVADVDTPVAVDVRGQLQPATVVPFPFYSRAR